MRTERSNAPSTTSGGGGPGSWAQIRKARPALSNSGHHPLLSGALALVERGKIWKRCRGEFATVHRPPPLKKRSHLGSLPKGSIPSRADRRYDDASRETGSLRAWVSPTGSICNLREVVHAFAEPRLSSRAGVSYSGITNATLIRGPDAQKRRRAAGTRGDPSSSFLLGRERMA